MVLNPCVCEGSNENCMHCFGSGYVSGKDARGKRNPPKDSPNDREVKKFLAKHPLLNTNPLQRPPGSEENRIHRRETGPHYGVEPPNTVERAVTQPSAPTPTRRILLSTGRRRPPIQEAITAAKEAARRFCPSCHISFAFEISLRAHLQAGCKKLTSGRSTRYVPPGEVEKRRIRKHKRVAKILRGLIKCTYCGSSSARTVAVWSRAIGCRITI